jgi:acyl-CoA synthetase (AMP-forming)/AMP-acid ligase II/thioesterase domain-containing protein/acyl carrier protein
MAVACLAVMAGAACAPLNPAYRANEFDFYLADLKAHLLIVAKGANSPARAVAQARSIPCLELAPGPEEAGLFTLCGPEATSPPAAVEAVPPDAVALLLHTSGTTARPKLVPLLQRNLCAAAYNISRSLELTPRDCCLDVMPLFHSQGLSMVYSSLAVGARVVCAPGFEAAQFYEWLDAFRPTWYSAAPTVQQAILEQASAHPETLARCQLRFIRATSAPFPLRVISGLERVFRAPVLEAYAMTEGPSQITCNPLPPRPRKPGSCGLATGPEVAVMDENGRRLPPGKIGEVVIRGAQVLQGYENNPEANARAFRDGWFRTGDLGYLDSEGYLFLRGRLKDMINRGGEKITPLEIDQVLLDHPAVAQAVAFAVPHARLGEDVAAAVVLQRDAAVTEAEIRAFAASRLADFKVPRQVVFLSELPKGATGKLQRLGLAEKLGLVTPGSVRPEGEEGFPAPGTDTEKKMAAIWAEVLKVQRIGTRDNFFHLGGDSLAAAHLLVQIEKHLGAKLPMSVLLEEATVAHLASLIDQQKESRFASALVPMQPLGHYPAFFCVHGVGGEVLSYTELAQHMAPDYPFYAFQAVKGSLDAEPPERLETMAAHYMEALRAVQPQGPYYLGGYSFGALIAYEMAQQLHALGQKVALLANIDQLSPLMRDRRVNWRSPVDLGRFLGNVPAWLWDDLCRPGPEGVFGAVRSKSRIVKQRLHHWLQPSRSWNAKREVEQIFDLAKIPGQFRRALETHYSVLRAYTPTAYPGRVTLFQARTRPLFRLSGPDLGWSSLVEGGLEIVKVPGNHQSVIKEPHVRVLAARLKDAIRKAQAQQEECESVSMAAC